MDSVEGKVAVITGGGSGIGLGMATVFAKAGMKIVLLDIEEAPLADAARGMQAEGAEVTSIACDVADRAAMFDAASAAASAYGKVHVLCNNAGVAGGGPIDTLDQGSWDWVWGVNQSGVLYGMQAFLPRIKEHGEGGHIVNTASMAGMVSMSPEWAPYHSSKFAVVSLTEVLRLELEGTNIGATVLCPGWVRTRIQQAGRNRPGRFGDAEARVGGEGIAGFIAKGLDPLAVGELVLSAILENRLYIFTDPGQRGLVQGRFDAIMDGFDWSAAHPAIKG